MAIKNKVIAVTGSPNSGKTTFSLELAKALAEYKENILVIHADDYAPVIPYLYDTKSQGSIGKVLMSNGFDKNTVLNNLVISEENKRVIALGYGSGENKFMYPRFAEEQILDMIHFLKQMFDWIVIDTSSYFLSSTLSLVSLRSADIVINVCNKSAKSLSYQRSMEQILEKERNIGAKYLPISNASEIEQNDTSYNDFIVSVDYYFDYIRSIDEAYFSGELIKVINDKKKRHYNETMDELITSEIIDESDE